MQHCVSTVLACFLVAAAPSSPAFAAISQTNAPTPGGFVQACAGPVTVGSPGWPGVDWTTAHFGTSDKHELSFTGNTSASLSASYSGGTISNGASATVGMGYATMSAYDVFTSAAAFSLGVANGGWNESFLISNPAHTGQEGFLQFTVHVVGSLAATGITGSAAITTTVYKDTSQVPVNPLFSPGNSDLLGSSVQYGNWGLATFGNPNSDSKNVNGTVTYAVPFTFGTSFKLGVYVNCRAGQRSSGGFDTPCTSDVSLTSFNWGGITSIYVNGAPVGGSSIVSGSGINWNPPIQPNNCPADIDGDGFVDDTDFVLFVVAYNILDCADPTMPAGCPADINGDGAVDDADFVVFVVGYNELICPE